MRLALILAVGCLVLAAGCDNPRNPPRGTVVTTFDTTGGIITVANTGEAPRFQIRHVYTANRSGPGEIERVRSLVALPGGRLFVADAGVSRILVFDSTGRFVETIGRNGHGPTEFTLLHSIAWLGNTLAAFDPGNARIELFGTRGEWLGSWPVQPLEGPRIRLLPLDSASIVVPWRLPGPAGGLLPVGVRFDAGGPRDTVPLPERPNVVSGMECTVPGGGFAFIDFPFAPRWVEAWVPPFTPLTAQTDEYLLRIADPRSDSVRVITYDIPPVAITDAEWAAAQDTVMTERARLGPSECEPRRQERPKGRPAFRSVTLDDAGRVWVERPVPGGYVFDLFTVEGRLVATVDAPARDPDVPPYIRGNRIYVTATSPDGTTTVSAWEAMGLERLDQD